MTWLESPEILRAKLAEWLAEREEDLALVECGHEEDVIDGGDASLVGHDGSLVKAPFDSEPPGLGEVRLLSPMLMPEEQMLPACVMVIHVRPNGGGFVVAPFSRYPVPGTAGEFLTYSESMPLRVLCVWNAQLLPMGALAHSWLVGQADTETVSLARALYRHMSFGERPPPALIERMGPPVAFEEDPRSNYQREEIRTWSGLLTRACCQAQALEAGVARQVGDPNSWLYQEEGKEGKVIPFSLEKMPMAAAGQSISVPVLEFRAFNLQELVFAEGDTSQATWLGCAEVEVDLAYPGQLPLHFEVPEEQSWRFPGRLGLVCTSGGQVLGWARPDPEGSCFSVRHFYWNRIDSSLTPDKLRLVFPGHEGV